ncbi:MAG: sulfite exporter TauE/SafE family protein [Burkholderiales bacterium]|nr:sulfite exporter TauE/SafE family protein [Burkholderiales bacterium]
MDLTLIVSATLLGLAGAPHCTVMCAAPCAAAVGRGGMRATLAFQFARLSGYAAVGGLAAASVSTLGDWSRVSPALRPAWALLHAAALALGLWLLLRGRQPDWMAALGRQPAAPTDLSTQAASRGAIPPMVRAGAAGALWVAWPCALLQSALLVAAMGNGAATGAAAMAGFALASAPGLLLAPWIWRRLLAGGQARGREAWATRGGGALLAVASVWALGHDWWPRVAAFCRTL